MRTLGSLASASLVQTSTRASCLLFNDTATTEISTLSLHHALPISENRSARCCCSALSSGGGRATAAWICAGPDRKSTRLNSSHSQISYAVFCLKKKKK